MANKPTNPQLYSRVKSEAKKKFDRWPSAYGSAWLVKEYKRRGGGYRKAEDGMEIPGYDLMANGGMMYGDYMFPMMDDGGEMALGQIAAVTDKMSKLQQFLNPNSEIEPWIASKLAVMDHSADAIYDYMMYNPEAQEQEGPEMEEMREGGIPSRYKNMGFNKVGVKKQSNRPGKKWMVLAKKGDKYKVVHGGYKGMQDYTQHRNKNRQKRFWDRMGGRNSAKATDPFSPLYWHKRFGTWAEGGEPQNEGFQALPEAVQAKIMANMMYGGDMYAMGGMPCYECGGMTYKEGGTPFIAMAYFGDGGIKIDPAKKGTFKAQATRMGMSVQEAANAILNAPKGKYSPEMRRKANFARNFAKEYGGAAEQNEITYGPTAIPGGMSPAQMNEFLKLAPQTADFALRNNPFDNTDVAFFTRGNNGQPLDEDMYRLQADPKGTKKRLTGELSSALFSDAKDLLKDRYADYSTPMKGFQSAANTVGDLVSLGSFFGKRAKESQALNEASRRTFSDNLFPTMPAGITGERGNWDVFGNFRPDETLASRTYFNQMGGEIEMTDDQIRQLVALGAEIEILD